MPYADPVRRREYDRDRKRASRAGDRDGAERLTASRLTDAERKRVTRAADKPGPVAAPGAPPADPVGALVEWSRSTLKVPPGHYQSEGQPMELPEYAVAFLRRAWGKREAGLFVARKNAKSAVIAVLLLAHLVGPLRRDGWRGAVVSPSRGSWPSLLKEQMEQIAIRERA